MRDRGARAEAGAVRLEAEGLASGLYRHRAVRFIFDLRRRGAAPEAPPDRPHGRADFSKR